MSEFGDTISGVVRRVLRRGQPPLTAEIGIAETSGVFQFPEAPPLDSSDWHQVDDKTQLWQLDKDHPTASAYIRLGDSILLLETTRDADGRITNVFTLTHINSQKVSPTQIQKIAIPIEFRDRRPNRRITIGRGRYSDSLVERSGSINIERHQSLPES